MRRAARCSRVSAVARDTGLEAADIETFYRWWSETQRVVSCYSQGVNQSAQGTDKVNAIINCHLATGRIGKPGSGPLSLTGQPNAMGGREVGGLANMLAAHMGYSEAERDRVRRFWGAPNLAQRRGPEGGADVRRHRRRAHQGAVGDGHQSGGQPAACRPRARGDARLELLVVSDNVASSDSVNLAHVRLPAAAWGEKDGTVTNSERRISRQRPFLPLPGEARPDWWMLAEVARRMGWAGAFAYRSAADVFREHASLSGFENNGARAVRHFGALTAWRRGLRRADRRCNGRCAAAPASGTERLFGDGTFAFPSRRARFVAVGTGRLANATDRDWPLLLNTGRVRDQWHTMTRTGMSPRLAVHVTEPFVEMHPNDAVALGLEQAMLARVETVHGTAVLRVMLSERQQPGSLFAPIHWSAENSSAGRDLRAGAARHRSRSRASPRPRRRRRACGIAGRRMGSCCRARLSIPAAWPTGPAHACRPATRRSSRSTPRRGAGARGPRAAA